MTSIVLITLSVSIAAFQLASCTKSTAQNNTTVTCDTRGTYTGTGIDFKGNTTTLTYTLADNNFAVGGLNPTSAKSAFGGYRNTCDSVILSIYSTLNNSYYLLRGKLTNNDSTISGSFTNTTSPTDYGTFTMSK